MSVDSSAPKFQQVCKYFADEISKNKDLEVKYHDLKDFPERENYCYIDFTLKDMKEKYGQKVQITSSIFVSGFKDRSGKERTIISTDILIPMCSTEKDEKFLLGPLYYNLCQEKFGEGRVLGCDFSQLHMHSGTLPTTHAHINCTVEEFPNQWHCIGKFVTFVNSITDFSKKTCLE